eukprot:g661.t1
MTQTSGRVRDKFIGRSRHTAVCVDRTIYVFGGVCGGNDVWALDTANESWRRLSPPQVVGDIPKPRFGHCSAAIGDHLYIFAGHDGRRSLQELYRFDTRGLTWKALGNLERAPPPSPNYVMLASHDEGDLLIFGSDFRLYRLHTNMDNPDEPPVWNTPLVDRVGVPSQRQQHSIVLVDGGGVGSTARSSYVVFGGAGVGQLYNEVYQLESKRGAGASAAAAAAAALDASSGGGAAGAAAPSDGSSKLLWSRMSLHGAGPTGRIGHTAVFYRRDAGSAGASDLRFMYIFGGTDRQQFFHDLYYLNFDAKMRWRDCARVHAQVDFQPRYGHTASTVRIMERKDGPLRPATLLLGGHTHHGGGGGGDGRGGGVEESKGPAAARSDPDKPINAVLFMPQTVEEAKEVRKEAARAASRAAGGAAAGGSLSDKRLSSRTALTSSPSKGDNRGGGGGGGGGGGDEDEDVIGEWTCKSAHEKFAKHADGPFAGRPSDPTAYMRRVQLASHTATYVEDLRLLYVFGGGSIDELRNMSVERTREEELLQPRTQYTINDSLWELDMRTSSWSWREVKQPATKAGEAVRMDWPSPRLGHAAVLRHHQLFIVGGFGGPSGNSYLGDVWSFNIDSWREHRSATGEWMHRYDRRAAEMGSKESERMMSHRLGHTCNLIRGDLIVFGGSCHGRPIDNDVYVFHVRDGLNDHWGRRSRDTFRGAAPCPRFGHTATMKNAVDEKIFISGGCGLDVRAGRTSEEPMILSDLFILDWKEKTWTTPNLRTSTLRLFGHRYRHSANVFNDNIMVFGGAGAESDPIAAESEFVDRFIYLTSSEGQDDDESDSLSLSHEDSSETKSMSRSTSSKTSSKGSSRSSKKSSSGMSAIVD